MKSCEFKYLEIGFSKKKKIVLKVKERSKWDLKMGLGGWPCKIGSCTWARGATNTALVVEYRIPTTERAKVDCPKAEAFCSRESVED